MNWRDRIVLLVIAAVLLGVAITTVMIFDTGPLP